MKHRYQQWWDDLSERGRNKIISKYYKGTNSNTQNTKIDNLLKQTLYNYHAMLLNKILVNTFVLLMVLILTAGFTAYFIINKRQPVLSNIPLNTNTIVCTWGTNSCEVLLRHQDEFRNSYETIEIMDNGHIWTILRNKSDGTFHALTHSPNCICRKE